MKMTNAEAAQLQERAEALGRGIALKEAASCIPDTWLDPLLTGPNAVVGAPPYGCQDIQRLCKALRERIDACASGVLQQGIEK